MVEGYEMSVTHIFVLEPSNHLYFFFARRSWSTNESLVFCSLILVTEGSRTQAPQIVSKYAHWPFLSRRKLDRHREQCTDRTQHRRRVLSEELSATHPGVHHIIMLGEVFDFGLLQSLFAFLPLRISYTAYQR